MSSTVTYKGNTIASMATNTSKTLTTAGKYCEADIIVTNVQDGGITPTGNIPLTATTSTQTGIDVAQYATASVAPTPSETKSTSVNGDVTPTSGKLLSKVTVNVPTGTARSSSDLTVSGATVTAPAGLYSSSASKSVASGTAGTPTATKGTVSNHAISVTPSVTNTTGYITGSTKTGTAVSVSASDVCSGTLSITSNGNGQDVTNYAAVNVNVPTGITPTGNKAITASTSTQTNIDVAQYATVSVAPTPTETKTVTANGTVTPSSGKYLSSVTVNVSSGGGAAVYADPTSKTIANTSYTASGVKVVIKATGTYNLYWSMARNTTSGTTGSRLYKSGTAIGTAVTTFSLGSNAQNCSLTNQSLTAGDTIEIYARSRSTSYNVYVWGLIAVKTN